MIEKYLIDHCSPTLASLKTANLINIPYSSDAQLCGSVSAMNTLLKARGVELLILKKQNGSALIYTYRKTKLQADLNKSGVFDFLKEYGYASCDAQYCIDRLKKRLALNGEFPHEIGIFLGYPLGDVIGFIENAGKNSKCSGCWKVYCNECEAIKTFAKYNKCRLVYQKMWQNGQSIVRMTVHEPHTP